MRSLQLEEALSRYLGEASELLGAEIAAGAEVPFELEQRGRRRGSSSPGLYCYRPLTGEFIAARQSSLERLPGFAPAARMLGEIDGIERYLADAGERPGARGRPAGRLAAAAILREVFAEQTDFELRGERLSAALSRLEGSTLARAGGATLVATLHGMAIGSPELHLASGLTIARMGALEGLPADVREDRDHESEPLVCVLSGEWEGAEEAVLRSRELLKDLLRSLRLFGDGRVTLGTLAWVALDGGGWRTIALGSGGRPHGMLLVRGEQEDELRAFCSLVSRRAPHGNELAWALRRFEIGCELDSPFEALTDHLLALRAILEPEGPGSGLLAGRVAALCATADQRMALNEQILAALQLERAILTGAAVADARGQGLAAAVADHLRALLCDVICGHLDHDLVAVADRILLSSAEPASAPEPSAEEMVSDLGEPEEILDLLI